MLAYCSIISMSGVTQVNEEWVARYNGPGNASDVGIDVAIDDEGNVYVTGSSTGVGTFLDYATIKYNAAGVQQWVARYNGPGNFFDEVADLAIDDEGNVYVTGMSGGIETGTDYATVKYNSAGVQQWVARYNGPGDSTDAAVSIAVDEAGNVYVTGRSGGIGTGLDYATIKYNTAGVQQWVARYNGPGDSTDRAQSLALDNNGNVYVTGSSVGTGTSFDYATIKYNSAGSELWVARFNGEGDGMDIANSIAVDNSGNVYVTGNIISGFIPEDPFPIELQDWGTVKYNASGVEQWVAIHDEGGDDFAVSVMLDNLGNVFVTGSISNSPPGLEEPDLDYGTIKYNASTGAEIWVAKYGPPPGTEFNAFLAFDQAVDSAGNVYVTGQSGTQEYATVKFDKNGVLQWAVTYTNGPNQVARAVAVDAEGNVYVTGGSSSTGSFEVDFATVKYSQVSVVACGKKGDKILICHKGKKTLCISKSDTAGHLSHGDQLGACAVTTSTANARIDQPSAGNNVMPAGFRVTVAPNPTAAATKIFYELPIDGRVSIKVFDMLGREVTTLVDAGKQAGFHSTDFKVAALQNGIYYYRITVKTAKKVWWKTGKINVIIR